MKMPNYWTVKPEPECLLVDLATVKTRLQIISNDDDAYLNNQIAFISKEIENYCERIFCANEYTQTWVPPADTSFVWNSRVIQLFHFPVNDIISVTVDQVVLDAADYTISTHDWTLTSQKFLSATDIAVVFNGGFTTIPADVAMAAEDLVVSRYMQRNADPTRIVRSESVPEVGSVDYLSAQYYQRGFDPVIGNYGTTLDRYRTERALVPDIST